MNYRVLCLLSWLTFATCWLSMARLPARELEVAEQAQQILDESGVRGGIIVHLGCGDGKFTAALRADERYTVHGLDTSSANVVDARKYLQQLGVYGPVSVEHLSSSALPYVDGLINLVVVQDASGVPLNEVMRILAPHGVACVKHADGWKQRVKPRPEDIGQWTHFLHDASNNAVTNDLVVGPPRSLQWLAPPLWLRSHETPSGIQSPVSANGRLFYYFDAGLIGITDERIPDRWKLVCRDAFNGKLLWERALDSWGWRAWNPEDYEGKDWTTLRGKRTDVPAEVQRRIVAQDDLLFATLGQGAPVSILDAATGETIATIDETKGATEILVSDGVVLTYTRQIPDEVARRRGLEDQAGSMLIAADCRTGQVRWKWPSGTIRPLALAIDRGRVVYVSGKDLVALDLQKGHRLWDVALRSIAPKTVVTVDDVVVMQGGKDVVVYDATDGALLWQKSVEPIRGAEGDDLFVIDGLVWRGMASVDELGNPQGKTPNALAVAWDLRSGAEKKRIQVNNLRSPEHHHRCYRNKATPRFLISSHEGAEFLDVEGENHGQNNWIRGVCKNGMMPCNGMLYVPPDQCFCQPGAKLLGYAALTAGPQTAPPPIEDRNRLVKGPAFGSATGSAADDRSDQWPTFRHDAARSGTTPTVVGTSIEFQWKVGLQGTLTAPVAADGRLLVAKPDAHTVYALEQQTGERLWQFTANGRIDSPPTVYRGMVLFGSKDGNVYCLRASDGELVWRFSAAVVDRRVASFGQLESAWPVHGSVLVDQGIAYFTAGRSTYLDGGIRVYGLDPATGSIRHKGLLEGPHRTIDGERDLGFFVLGANSDVLVSEGGFLYMRQKKLTRQLEEVEVEVLSSKGAQDVGLHVFSTSGLLDGSWYNRTFWMYSKRWPGFQLANQAPKSGQLLVVDDKQTYALRVFYRRNTHSPMFFPGEEGYLVFADSNRNEPQIVGEEGSREPIQWLPQSDYSRGRGNEMRALESEAFGLDKMVGYTRAEPPVWATWLPVRVRAMVKAADTLFVAGAPDELDSKDPYAAFEDRRGAKLVALSASDGQQLAEIRLDYPPVFDGMIAAEGRLFASLRDGSIVCLAGKN